MNALKEAQRTGKEPQENNSPEVENILNNLDKYGKILRSEEHTSELQSLS